MAKWPNSGDEMPMNTHGTAFQSMLLRIALHSRQGVLARRWATLLLWLTLCFLPFHAENAYAVVTPQLETKKYYIDRTPSQGRHDSALEASQVSLYYSCQGQGLLPCITTRAYDYSPSMWFADYQGRRLG